MISTGKKFKTIDEYIKSFPEDVQTILENIRRTIQQAAPEATETISYQIPTFKLHGNLVHFAAFKNHIGFYPTPKAIEVFNRELSAYEVSKGTIRFPLGEEIQYDLIEKITLFRVNENLKKIQKSKQKENV
jgi:uncharacterized protein YdhG (YjbR/CyaY superfamily)